MVGQEDRTNREALVSSRICLHRNHFPMLDLSLPITAKYSNALMRLSLWQQFTEFEREIIYSDKHQK